MNDASCCQVVEMFEAKKLMLASEVHDASDSELGLGLEVVYSWQVFAHQGEVIQ